MLGRAIQTGSCVCHCVQNLVPACTALSVRGVHHNNTWVFERLWNVQRPRKHNQPRLKRKHRVLIPQYPQIPNKTIKCILTEEIGSLGYKGAVVEVATRAFRYKLYPTGKALYASPENLEANEEYLKSEEAQKYKGIDIKMKHLMHKLSGVHLRIPMNSENSWILNKSHLRVAFRHMGIILEEDSLSLPEKPVTQPGEVIIAVSFENKLRTQVRGTVYLAADNDPVDPSLEFPDPWGNPPVSTDNPVQLINS